MAAKKWTFVPRADQANIDNLVDALKINPVLAQLLAQRDVKTYDEAFAFFRPQLSALHSPFLMQDMDKAVDRIQEALKNDEMIMVYGDYDVDGTTAVTLVYHFFQQFTDKLCFYVPDRYTEGYGISTQGIDYAKKLGVSLIIALDCGIRELQKVSYANSLGIDFIICDHHLPGDSLPEAFAVLDPKRADCAYPFKELSGCGIGFKLVQAYCIANKLDEAYYLCYLDLCLVSIAADIVPIVGENRILAHHGLIKLNKNPSIGLASLMAVASQKKQYAIADVVFLLAPRINAAGRMGHASDAVKLLLSKEQDAAKQNSDYINEKNKQRKEDDADITQQALAQIEQDSNQANRTTTVVHHPSWNKGVIGIVASRLTETYYRPTVVLTQSNGVYTGSARSVHGFDLYQALQQCDDLLLQFGGHKFAAGLTIAPENLEAFAQKFEQVVSASIRPEQLEQAILIDARLELNQITDKFCRVLAQMGPFGPQNMSPVFIAENISLNDAPRIVGEKHLKLSLKQQNSHIFDAIGFGMSEFEEALRLGKAFDICFNIEQNVWNDKVTTQLNLKGIQIKEV